MSEREFVDALGIASGLGGNFALIFWGLFLVKKYVLNGSVERFFRLKEGEVSRLARLETTTGSMLKNQQDFLDFLALLHTDGSGQEEKNNLQRRWGR